MGTFSNNESTRSVIYAKFTPPVTDAVAQWLRRGNIRKVIGGHSPRGDAPCIHDSNGIQVRASVPAAVLCLRLCCAVLAACEIDGDRG